MAALNREKIRHSVLARSSVDRLSVPGAATSLAATPPIAGMCLIRSVAFLRFLPSRPTNISIPPTSNSTTSLCHKGDPPYHQGFLRDCSAMGCVSRIALSPWPVTSAAIGGKLHAINANQIVKTLQTNRRF
jgi:hypothetical protein